MADYDHVVTMYNDGKPYERHFVKHKYGQPKWYVMTISLNAYRRRESGKCIKSLGDGRYQMVHYKGKRGHVQFADEYEIHKNVFANVGIREELPEFRHESWFDFYKAVGYDYKRKKYLSQ